ncbi:hypothetical protein NQ176_g4599 [Zarea fungicola]|uniref:Uncharacterized protein n=1 Tax=Zarea fungicola TaxID=93591 RepID=A0ACC1NEK6_9HYPO|nr:hypothetical protein NQ176_g4599 [Lecanicillium fungicola]
MIAWADMQVSLQSTGNFTDSLRNIKSSYERLSSVLDAVPLLDAVDKHFGGKAPDWLRGSITNPDPNSAFWATRNQSNALGNAKIPILLTTGWDDLMLNTVMDQHAHLQARGAKVGLTIGPWTHGSGAGSNGVAATLAWLEEYYTRRKVGERKELVRVFITGAEVWRDMPLWPPQTTASTLFLSSGGKLTPREPSSSSLKKEEESSFVFDPTKPTPSIGAPMLLDSGTLRTADDSILASRADVVTFTTTPLQDDVEVCGRIAVELYHATSTPHADIWVLISEVKKSGRSRSIADCYLRLDPDRDQGQPLRLTLHDCGHRFSKESRIRLLVAGSSHPRYIRNLGTGDGTAMGDKVKTVTHTIQHNQNAVSKLTLPTCVFSK